MSVGIGVIGFNRPKLLETTVNSIVGQRGVDDCEVVIFLDGPRNKEDEAACNDCLQVSQNYTNVRVQKSSVNLGLKHNVILAILDLTRKHEVFIILEDDIVLADEALPNILRYLSVYAKFPEIFNISLFSLASPFRYQEYLANRFLPWGWAGWSAKWLEFIPENLFDLEFTKFRCRVLHNSDLNRIARASNEGEVSSWYIYVMEILKQHNLYSLYIDAKLVTNEGFNDIHATHTRNRMFFPRPRRGIEDLNQEVSKKPKKLSIILFFYFSLIWKLFQRVT